MVALLVGAVFAYFHVPAGWLLGSLLTGIFTAFYVKKLIFSDGLFKISLAVIGCNIGFMVIPSHFLVYKALIGPFFLTLILTIGCSLLLRKFMLTYSNLHPNTAFFCCLPGGASEVIALSKDYGADQQIVAAFHTSRITLFVLFIPFIVGIYTPVVSDSSLSAPTPDAMGGSVAVFTLFVVMVLTMKLAPYIRFPGASLFLSIGLGFVAHQWIVPFADMPSIVTGIAQGFMGAIIGIRFDRETFSRLRQVGLVSFLTLLLYMGMSFILAFIFYLLTPLEFFTSLLGIVPAGAAEMASTATALQVEPTLVATLQMLRVLTLFLLLPFLIKWFTKPVHYKNM